MPRAVHRLAQTSVLGGLRFREAKRLYAMAGAQPRFAAANLADIKTGCLRQPPTASVFPEHATMNPPRNAARPIFQHYATSLYYNRKHFLGPRGV